MLKLVYRNLVIGLLLAGSVGVARAQTTNWVAFNACIPLNANVSRFYLPSQPNPAATNGFLKNVANGTNLPVYLTITNLYGNAVTAGGLPGLNTPATNIFGAYAAFGTGITNNAYLAPYGVMTLTFSNLNPGVRYNFKATAVRALSPSTIVIGNYGGNRWLSAKLVGALSFRHAHTSNVLSAAVAGFASALATNEAALCTGLNTNGDIVDFEDIVVGSNGILSVVQSIYTNIIPTKYGAPGNVGTNYNAFTFTTFRIAEMDVFALTSQPSSVSVCPGAQATFTVGASGKTPWYFQWYKTNGVSSSPITAATNQTYSIATTALTDLGGYFVVASNSANAVTSSIAQLVLGANPVVLATQPSDVIAPLTYSATFTVAATADSSRPLAYQWYYNAFSNTLGATLLSGATSNSYNLASADDPNAGYYFAVVTNCTSAVTSRVASLSVYYTPVGITNNPYDTTVAMSGAATLSVGAAGSRLSYQWLKNNVMVTNATNANLTFANAQINDSGVYSVLVSNKVSAAVSSGGIFYVQPPPYTWLPMKGYNWKFNQDGLELGTAWRAPNYNDSTWSNGLSVLAYETGNAIADANRSEEHTLNSSH